MDGKNLLLVEKLHKYSCYRIKPKAIDYAASVHTNEYLARQRKLIKRHILLERITLKEREQNEMVDKVLAMWRIFM